MILPLNLSSIWAMIPVELMALSLPFRVIVLHLGETEVHWDMAASAIPWRWNLIRMTMVQMVIYLTITWPLSVMEVPHTPGHQTWPDPLMQGSLRMMSGTQLLSAGMLLPIH